MSVSRVLLLFLCAFSLSIDRCSGVKCHPPARGILPQTPHCAELIRQLLTASHAPGVLRAKDWGRRLNNTPTTVHLPKTYWISGAGPTTCGVQVDVDPRFPEAVERFGLMEVAYAAEHALSACLVRKGEVGMERVGLGRKVEVWLDRVDLSLVEDVRYNIVDSVSEGGREGLTEY